MRAHFEQQNPLSSYIPLYSVCAGIAAQLSEDSSTNWQEKKNDRVPSLLPPQILEMESRHGVGTNRHATPDEARGRQFTLDTTPHSTTAGNAPKAAIKTS
jgi:hypothetical protein